MTTSGEHRPVLGGYQLLSRLKSGGMGEVVLGRKVGVHGFERLVAIKTIRTDLQDREKFRTMFLDEARLMAKLHHPAIAQVHDFGEEKGLLYLVMEYVAGETFRALSKRRPPPGVVVQAMSLVCNGLHAAHELRDPSGRPYGVVHRDITPQNLILTFDGAVKILDFGIALVRDRESPATEFGTVKGKIPYLAPEQIANDSIDRRTDIYAASLCLHELLTGERVFKSNSIYAVARQIDKGDIPRPTGEAGRLTAGLDDLVMMGLRRNPDDRFQSALALAQALDEVAGRMGGESLQAYTARELTDARKKHEQQLQKLVSETNIAVAFPPGRDLATVPDSTGATTAHTGPADPAAPAVRTGRRWLLAGLALVLIALGAGIALLAIPADDPGPVVTPPVVDAEPETIPDAGITSSPRPDQVEAAPIKDEVEAPVKKRRRRRPPRRRKAAKASAAKPEGLKPFEPVPEAWGYVTIGAKPYALVRIDGKEVGTTPITRHRLRVGEHEVILVRPDTGAVRHRQSVAIEEGKTRKVVVNP